MISRRVSMAGAAAVVALAVIPAACGGSDDEGTGGAVSADTTQQGKTSDRDPAGDRRAIRKEVLALQEDFYGARARSWCDRISAHAAAATAKAAGSGKTCEDVLKDRVPMPVPAAIAKQSASKAFGIKLNGDKAAVRMSAPGEPPAMASYVWERGRWRLDNGLKLPRAMMGGVAP